MKQEYIEVSSYEEVGYKPVIDYMEWRVAVLNYIDELEVQNIETMQKHNVRSRKRSCFKHYNFPEKLLPSLRFGFIL